MSQYDTTVDLKLNVVDWSLWHIFHGPVILSYLENYLMYELHTLGL